MKKIFPFFLIFIFKVSFAQQKAPAYPLITHDPYFSIWSMTDTLNNSVTKHWTGTAQSLLGVIKVDSKYYRVIGNEEKISTSAIIAAEQKKITINATQTIYDFNCGPITTTITFTSPLIITDIQLLSRPVSYITYSVKANDGKTHDVDIYFGASTNIAANTSDQEIITQE